LKVIVDTCVWSIALRRQKIIKNEPFVLELQELIKEARIQVIGPIRQEILSGIGEKKQFDKLKKVLAAFPDLELGTYVYEEAAHYFNVNRAKGIQGSNTDFLICAVSNIFKLSILTFDKDFLRFRNNIPLTLHHPRVQ
jgi:predicted nucleic acid-binding protein